MGWVENIRFWHLGGLGEGFSNVMMQYEYKLPGSDTARKFKIVEIALEGEQ